MSSPEDAKKAKLAKLGEAKAKLADAESLYSVVVEGLPEDGWQAWTTDQAGAFRSKVLAALSCYLEPDGTDDMRVDGERLYAWFVVRLLCSDAMFGHFQEGMCKLTDKKSSHNRFCRRFMEFVVRIVTAAHLELEDELYKAGDHSHRKLSAAAHTREREEKVRDRDFLAAVAYVVAEYAYREIGVSRALDIERHLRSIYTSEILLYTIKEFYRDHLWHAIQVWLLGLLLLDARDYDALPALYKTKEGMPRVCAPDRKRQDYLQNWTVAALFHDIGYGLKVLEEIIDQVAFLRSPAINALKQSVRSTIEEEVHRFANFDTHDAHDDVPIEMKPASDELDHGVVSYSHVCDLLGSYGDGAGDRKKYGPALQAIAWHNRFDEPVEWRKNPISLLLVLCDELQEWKRDQIERKVLQDEFVAHLAFGDTSYLPRTRFVEELTVSVSLAVDSTASPPTFKVSQQDPKLLKIMIRYEPSHDETKKELRPKFLVPYIWLSRLQNLQRANFDFFQHVELRMIHPLPASLKDKKKSEWSLLREFCDDEKQDRLSWIQPWIDASGPPVEQNDREVVVKTDGTDQPVETVTLQVHELSKGLKPVFRSAEEILDGYPEWRKERHKKEYKQPNK